jgi:hypothetical protein
VIVRMVLLEATVKPRNSLSENLNHPILFVLVQIALQKPKTADVMRNATT